MYANHKIYIRYKNSWVDVTDRKLIIYGAGNGCFEMLNVMQLSNVAYVIDGAKKLHGTDILIQNKLYRIETPDIIKALDTKQYYIVISSILYEREIRTRIDELSKGKMISCIWNKELFYSYENIEDMFIYDPIINKKLLQLNLSFYRLEIVKGFYEIQTEFFQQTEISYFIPIFAGMSKLVFLFGNKDNNWIYSIRGKNNSINKLEMQKSDEISFLKRYHFLLENHLQDEITLFSKEDGVMVQHYAAERIDFDDWDIRKKIIEECRYIHGIEPNGLTKNYFVETVEEEYKRKKGEYENSEWFDALDELMGYCIEKIEYSDTKTLIHGDLIFENIVSYDKKIVFIDWEFLSVGNPMIDICYFLYSIQYDHYVRKECTFAEMCQLCFSELQILLQIYCHNKTEFKMYLDMANAVMCLYIVRGILYIYPLNPDKASEMIRNFLSSVKFSFSYD